MQDSVSYRHMWRCARVLPSSPCSIGGGGIRPMDPAACCWPGACSSASFMLLSLLDAKLLDGLALGIGGGPAAAKGDGSSGIGPARPIEGMDGAVVPVLRASSSSYIVEN